MPYLVDSDVLIAQREGQPGALALLEPTAAGLAVGGNLGLGDQSWGVIQGSSTLEVVDSLEAWREKIPADLYDMVAGVAEQPAVEDLDI